MGIGRRLASLWLWVFAALVRHTPSPIKHFVDLASSLLFSALRLGSGARVVRRPVRRPVKQLHLYSYDACPFCRKVHEAISSLDLDVVVHPCPRVTLRRYGVTDGSRHRPRVAELGGRSMFPFLVDENTGVRMYESGEIIRYLYTQYGGVAEGDVAKSVPYALSGGRVAGLLTFAPMLLRCRAKNGLLRLPSRAEPPRALRLTSYEAEFRWRPVRETLACLELTYELVTVPFGTEKRGKPLRLEDPNTGADIRSAREAVRYLLANYADGDFPAETLLDSYTTEGASAAHGSIPGAKRRAE